MGAIYEPGELLIFASKTGHSGLATGTDTNGDEEDIQPFFWLCGSLPVSALKLLL